MYTEVWFTDQNSNPLAIGDKINITLVINWSITYKNDTLFSSTKRSIFAKCFGCLSFVKNMSKYTGTNIRKNLNSSYSQKFLGHAKQSATDALKTASKRASQKKAEATVDLIGNKIADKITRVSKTSPNNN